MPHRNTSASGTLDWDSPNSSQAPTGLFRKFSLDATRRQSLGGYLPRRITNTPPLELPPLDLFKPLLDGSADREISTTMAFVRILTALLKDKNIGKQMHLNDGEQVELESLLLSANGFGLLRKLQQGQGGADFKLGGTTQAPMSKDEVFALFNDPRANPRDVKFEQRFLDNAEAQMEALRARMKA